MSLGDQRRAFAKNLGILLVFITSRGYGVGLGDTFPGKFKHNPKGQHPKGLAIDLDLYDSEGNYLTETEDHKEFGEFWEALGGTWGGRFRNRDGNHYSWDERVHS